MIPRLTVFQTQSVPFDTGLPRIVRGSGFASLLTGPFTVSGYDRTGGSTDPDFGGINDNRTARRQVHQRSRSGRQAWGVPIAAESEDAGVASTLGATGGAAGEGSWASGPAWAPSVPVPSWARSAV